MNLNALFKSLIWDELVKKAIAKILLAVPFLAWGPLGWLTKWAVTKIADKLYEALKDVVDFKVIALKNKTLRKEFDRASIKLYAIGKDKGINSHDFKKARQKHKEALAALVHFSI